MALTLVSKFASCICKPSNSLITDSIITIGESTFYGTQVISLKLGASVTSIGDSAFALTTITSSLTISSSVLTIEGTAVGDTQLLRQLRLDTRHFHLFCN